MNVFRCMYKSFPPGQAPFCPGRVWTKKGGSYVNQPILQIFHLSQGLAGQKRDNCRAENGCEKAAGRQTPPTHSVSEQPPPGRGSDKKSLICKTALVLVPEAVAALTRGAPSSMQCSVHTGEFGWGRELDSTVVQQSEGWERGRVGSMQSRGLPRSGAAPLLQPRASATAQRSLLSDTQPLQSAGNHLEGIELQK